MEKSENEKETEAKSDWEHQKQFVRKAVTYLCHGGEFGVEFSSEGLIRADFQRQSVANR